MEAKFVSSLKSSVTQVTPQKSNAADVNTPAKASESTDAARAKDVEGFANNVETKGSNVTQFPTDEKALDELIGNLNQHIQTTTRALKFSIDHKYGRPIVSVVDKETDEVIRQIPPEVALQVADALDEATGALVSERA